MDTACDYYCWYWRPRQLEVVTVLFRWLQGTLNRSFDYHTLNLISVYFHSWRRITTLYLPDPELSWSAYYKLDYVILKIHLTHTFLIIAYKSYPLFFKETSQNTPKLQRANLSTNLWPTMYHCVHVLCFQSFNKILVQNLAEYTYMKSELIFVGF